MWLTYCFLAHIIKVRYKRRMMDTQPSINSLACIFTSVLFLSSSELRLIKVAWDRCMGYALGLGMLMNM